MNEEYIRIFNETEDIVQSVFNKLYKNFDKFEDDICIKKWLTRVTINECKTLFLSAWKRKIFPITDKEENVAIDKPKDANLIDSLFQLPKKYRMVLFLFYYEDYKIKEIAEILNVKESTIKTRLNRGRSLLKDILKGGIQNE